MDFCFSILNLKCRGLRRAGAHRHRPSARRGQDGWRGVPSAKCQNVKTGGAGMRYSGAGADSRGNTRFPRGCPLTFCRRKRAFPLLPHGGKAFAALAPLSRVSVSANFPAFRLPDSDAVKGRNRRKTGFLRPPSSPLRHVFSPACGGRRRSDRTKKVFRPQERKFFSAQNRAFSVKGC